MLSPQSGNGKGVCQLDLLVSFYISITASIIAYYICKWLDGDK